MAEHSLDSHKRSVAKHAPELYNLAFWIVNGDPRRPLAERLSSIQKRARSLLAMKDPGIGKIISGGAARDAIHIAVAPMVAEETLVPGQHVGLVSGRASAASAHIGVVDPYLTRPVQSGEKFWLFLYPNTITSLRHEWTHPVLNSESEVWLADFAEHVGVSYDVMMRAADDWLQSREYHCLSYDTPDRAYRDRFEFWHHYEIVTGTKVKDHEATFFTCSC